MRRCSVHTATLLLVAGLFAATTAHALGGIDLYWDGCSLDPHASARTFACDTDTGEDFALFVSFATPGAVPRFVGAALTMNFAFDDVAIPSWWQVAAGECRAGAITVGWAAADVAGSCPDPWNGQANLAVTQFLPASWRSNAFRLVTAAAVPADSAVYLPDDGPEYALCHIAISRAHTTGPGACAGCALGACMIAEQLVLYQDSPGPSFTLTTPLHTAFATWNNAYPNCSADVPVRNRSWGQVKSLYR